MNQILLEGKFIVHKTAAILVIGNEILCGRTKDVNLHFLANELDNLGILVRQARVVADVEEDIVEAVNALRHKYDYVFTTGGIGPTHDDITAQSIAKAFQREFTLNKQAFDVLQNYYGENFTPVRQRMAYMPVGAELLNNPESTAPGFKVDNVYVMAGFPSIMREMFKLIAPSLQSSEPMFYYNVTAQVGESAIAVALEDAQNTYPEIEFGSYPFYENNKVGVTIVLRAHTQDMANNGLESVKKIFENLNLTYEIGQGKH